ncbi:hypothetical protein KFL_005720050 [Klebsormidium nitens]|uniref:FAM194 C-terminal domain-containing protein n=1 Tax=Klebsormidium nitens TaxID=105231 RepID=A0A1Y1IG92_KLENI|nr:hypothetical protein KFL_005720050 [Klebsormidium nitens]|eukprot:GAQ89875.1 hypothetical protein KFL_005720050 [Klebsormidium nitens]
MSSFYEDSNRRRLLCWFTSQGEGKIYYETGQVRVSMTKTDCTFFAPDGHVARKWTWPRLLKQPEEIRLGERINVTLIDGDNIVTKLKLQKNGRITEFESGRAARR